MLAAFAQAPQSAPTVDAAPLLAAWEQARPESRPALLDGRTFTLEWMHSVRLLAVARGRRGDWSGAGTAYELVIEIARRVPRLDWVVWGYSQLGQAYRHQDRFEDAIVAFETGQEAARAAAPAEVNRVQLQLAWLTDMKAQTLEFAGQYEEAVRTCRSAIDLFAGLKDAGGSAAARIDLGAVYRRMGEFQKAAAATTEAIAIAEGVKGAEYIAGNALNNLGAIYAEQGFPEIALTYTERSIAEKRRTGAAESPLISSLINYAQLLYDAGRIAQARAAIEEAMPVARRTQISDALTGALHTRASISRAEGKPETAIIDLREALGLALARRDFHATVQIRDLWAQVLLDTGDKVQALEQLQQAAAEARGLKSDVRLAQALAGLAQGQVALGRKEQARSTLDETIRLTEAMRLNTAGGGEADLNFLEGRAEPYRMLAGLLADGQPEEALRVTERAKGRVLLDALQGSHTQIRKAMTAAEQARERELEAAVIAARRRGPEALDRARRELLTFRSALFTAHPELRFGRGQMEPLSVAGAGALLPDAATALLEYLVTEERVLLFTLTRESAQAPVRLRVFTLPITARELPRVVDAYRSAIAARDLGYSDIARKLYARVLAPAEAVLRGKTRLIVVPDAALWQLPFHALVRPSGRHLLDDAAVFFAPSLTTLAAMRQSRPREYGSHQALLAYAHDVPGAETEAAALHQLWGRERSLVRAGAAASKSRFQAESGGFRIVHVAAHGVLNNGNPLYSYLALAPSSPGAGDGQLEAREILQMNLRADLVVLSACETARGGWGRGEGLVGTAWAMAVAGASSSLVSQWKVDAAATSEFMRVLHSRLRTRLQPGQPLRGKSAVVREAALALARSPETRHPFYWAGFVLFGDGY